MKIRIYFLFTLTLLLSCSDEEVKNEEDILSKCQLVSYGNYNFEYRTDGRLHRSYLYYESDGYPKRDFTYTYLTDQIIASENGSNFKYRMKLDSKGNITEVYDVYNDGELIGTKYSYDTKNRIIKIENYNTEFYDPPLLIGTSEFTYNANENISKVIFTNSDNVTNETVLIYESKINPLSNPILKPLFETGGFSYPTLLSKNLIKQSGESIFYTYSYNVNNLPSIITIDNTSGTNVISVSYSCD